MGQKFEWRTEAVQLCLWRDADESLQRLKKGLDCFILEELLKFRVGDVSFASRQLGRRQPQQPC